MLTDQQQAFLDAYLETWNATRAAIEAGYSEHTARQQGSRLLTNVDIQQAIKARLIEKAMEADEVLARLADQARGTMEDFLYVGPKGKVKIDLAKAARAGKLHLLHRYSKGKGGIVAFELYDAQTALAQLAKLLGLYPAEKLDVNIRDLDTAIEHELARVAAKRKAEAAGAAAPTDSGTDV